MKRFFVSVEYEAKAQDDIEIYAETEEQAQVKAEALVHQFWGKIHGDFTVTKINEVPRG